ncbi:hypothetical protein WN944_000812 [Citrus x changshan-huyou]|uniref:Peptidase A1 domain-containing protein n=1 Tax=Citrus x changshan-huyou TaxID=2935761 RepID=A0AAP0MIJ7_9ROSI
MASKKFLSYALFPFFLCLSTFNPTKAQNSQKLPFYNDNETPKSPISIIYQAEIISVDDIYLMHLSIGTPPVDIFGSVDTGSDCTWTKCEPCPELDCFKQEPPLFEPKKSSTYNSISCSSSQCAIVASNCSEGDCSYSFLYGRGAHASFSSGNLATETLTFNSTSGLPVEMPNVIFGCGHKNLASPTSDSKQTGIIGLGPGNSSLISQMGTSIAGKFSYCLPDQGSSKINFGGIVAGAGVVSTPLIIRDHYYLSLEAISVGNQRLEFVSSSTGNIFVDTGVLRTLLPLEYHSNLKSVMSNMIKAQPVKGVGAEPGFSDVLCYNISSQPKFPEVTIHFRGADVKLNPSNLFRNISDEIMCSAFRGGNANIVYGRIMQINFLIGYDIEQAMVSFKPSRCTNY